MINIIDFIKKTYFKFYNYINKINIKKLKNKFNIFIKNSLFINKFNNNN